MQLPSRCTARPPEVALVAITVVALGLNQLRRQRTARKKAAEDLKFRSRR
ncbi:MAG: hypothetical protein IPQ07_37275 [Myxococcales bacterium]|nr:hypothetical protein [Myxococcales bacterium]